MRFLILTLFLCMALYADSINNQIHAKLLNTFQKTYPTMNIRLLKVVRTSHLPKNFESATLEDIYISPTAIERNSGNISAMLKIGNKKRKIFYRYTIDATVNVLRATAYIQRGKVLTDEMVDSINIKFANFYEMPITPYFIGRYKARTSIIEGKILTTRHVTKITPINRGDIITARLQDGGVIVTFQAEAMQDARIGDTIKIKRDYGSFFQAKVISNTMVEVIE